MTVRPDILVYPRAHGRDEFVVLACDGIWDRLTRRECVDLFRSLVHNEGEADTGLLCEEVIDTALEKDSRDNMTVCAVFFPGALPGADGSRVIYPLDSIRSKDSEVLRGVARQWRDRTREWGLGSTPAKRAQERLEERRRKEKEIATPAGAKAPKSQGRKKRQGGLRAGPSQNSPELAAPHGAKVPAPGQHGPGATGPVPARAQLHCELGSLRRSAPSREAGGDSISTGAPWSGFSFGYKPAAYRRIYEDLDLFI